jgi:hypothetical protein
LRAGKRDVDGRGKPGHDSGVTSLALMDSDPRFLRLKSHLGTGKSRCRVQPPASGSQRPKIFRQTEPKIAATWRLRTFDRLAR